MQIVPGSLKVNYTYIAYYIKDMHDNKNKHSDGVSGNACSTFHACKVINRLAPFNSTGREIGITPCVVRTAIENSCW